MVDNNDKPTPGNWDVPDYARPPEPRSEDDVQASPIEATPGVFMQDPQRMLDTLAQGIKQDMVNLIAWRAHALEVEEQRIAQAQQRKSGSSTGMMDALSTAMRPDEQRKERDKIARGCAVYPILAIWAVGMFLIWQDPKWWPLFVIGGILQVGWVVWSMKAPPLQRRKQRR